MAKWHARQRLIAAVSYELCDLLQPPLPYKEPEPLASFSTSAPAPVFLIAYGCGTGGVGSTGLCEVRTDRVNQPALRRPLGIHAGEAHTRWAKLVTCT